MCVRVCVCCVCVVCVRTYVCACVCVSVCILFNFIALRFAVRAAHFVKTDGEAATLNMINYKHYTILYCMGEWFVRTDGEAARIIIMHYNAL